MFNRVFLPLQAFKIDRLIDPQHPAQYDLNIFQNNRQVHFTLIIKPDSCLHCEPAAQEAPLLL